jgi:hypothetical protein
MIMDAPDGVDLANDRDERWPAPVATLFIVTSSLALWGLIYVGAGMLFG